MSSPAEQRKLAAIMFTDMVGYSALSQRDEKLAQELLEEHRRLLREIFPRFNGTEIKTIGDAFLVEFNSALEAAQCAIEIQRALAKRNADAVADRQIELKIGIHIGDVVHRDGDVYGDGVNIASRIEPLAGAGGICVSMDVERQIRNAVETRFEKLAPTELKNISVAMDLFRIVLPWEHKSEGRGQKSAVSGRRVIAARSKWVWAGAVVIGLLVIALLAFLLVWRDRRARRTDEVARNEGGPPGGRSLPLPSIPAKSVAVLPFENLSDDKSNAYFADGIQDEILTRLSKIADLKVISRSSTQKYKSAPDNLHDVGQQLGVANLLEGSVQKIANAVHINVQLIRAATDEHLWAESYNRKLDDVFAVEGEVATTIAQELNVKLSGAEKKAVADKPTQNQAAYDAYLRGVAIENRGLTLEGEPEAVAAFAESVRLDPQFAPAWARLAAGQSFLYFNGRASASSVKEAADRALALEPDSGEAWLAQAGYRYRVLRNFPSALEAYREAQKRLPNSADVLEQMAHLERRLGRPDVAEAHYRAAAQLDPQNLEPLLSLWEVLGAGHRFTESEEVNDRIQAISPGNEEALAYRALDFQAQGRLTDSAAVLSRINPSSQSELVAIVRQQQLMLERRFEEAIARVKSNVPAHWANDPRTITTLGYLQEWAGHKEEARQTFLQAVAAMQPADKADKSVAVDARRLPAWLARAYAGLNEKEKALEQGRRAVVAYQDDALSLANAAEWLAQIQARFGDADSALAALPHLLQVPNGPTTALLKMSPYWDPLRNDPRFQKLCQEPNK
jgi:TolB-like protein/class 3 adenylate cyclase/Flp pilus assembly protein TadD